MELNPWHNSMLAIPQEITVAVHHILQTYLYGRLPRRRVDALGEELERHLYNRFKNSWSAEKPSMGSSLRVIKFGNFEVDPSLLLAIDGSGLSLIEVQNYLPKDMIMYIDPGEVSVQSSDKNQGTPVFIFKSHLLEKSLRGATCDPDNSKQQSLGETLSPSENEKMFDGESTTLDQQPIIRPCNLKLTSNDQFVNHRSFNDNNNHFTVQSFMQTKFGSTKLRTNKRPNKLSPNDFNHNLGARFPLSVSPSGTNSGLIGSPQRHSNGYSTTTTPGSMSMPDEMNNSSLDQPFISQQAYLLSLLSSNNNSNGSTNLSY